MLLCRLSSLKCDVELDIKNETMIASARCSSDFSSPQRKAPPIKVKN
jgi:hypothetical protein